MPQRAGSSRACVNLGLQVLRGQIEKFCPIPTASELGSVEMQSRPHLQSSAEGLSLSSFGGEGWGEEAGLTLIRRRELNLSCCARRRTMTEELQEQLQAVLKNEIS
jgi:hypothetical protein